MNYYDQLESIRKYSNFRREKKDKSIENKYFFNDGFKGIRDLLSAKSYKIFY